MIAVGQPAPDFDLPAQGGARFRLSDWRGRANVLVLFLPAAFTPICSTEVPAADALLDRFAREAHAVVVAVTTDNAPSNLAWARDCGAKRLLVLSDFWPHGAVARAYGVLAQDGVAERSTALIDRRGIVRYANVAGRYGKRALPELLAIATRVDGGRPAPAGASREGLLPKLDLPVLYASKNCGHCARVRAFLADSGLSRRVVVREVDSDPAAMRELLAIDPEGATPTLLMPDGLAHRGDLMAIHELRRLYRV